MTNFSLSLRQSAARHPDRRAVVDGGTTLTYAELDARVDALARGLLAAGTTVGSTVAVVSQNCLEFVELYFAVLRVGGVFLPLNFRLAAPEITYQLDRAEVDLLFVGEGSADIARDAVAASTRGIPLVPLGTWASPSGWPSYEGMLVAGDPVPDAPRSLDDIQRIMFTSGTTSHPKAALTSHGQVWLGALVRATEFQFTERDVNLVNGPLSHAGALDHFATTHLMVGGCVVITRGFDGGTVLGLLGSEGVTNTWLSPSMARVVVGVPGWEDARVGSLRLLLLSGEKAPEHLLRRIQEAWPEVGINDCYGLTESSFATYVPAAQARRKLGSVGRASLGTRVRVVGEGGEPLPAGEAGEIHLAGLCVFPGYFADPDATEAALHDGWLHTGDIGYLDDDGYLFVVDRAKDMIRSGGENIASPEVERVLYEVPGVLEAAVVGAPDDRWGEVPVAFVVSDPDVQVSELEVIQHARARLAKYKVPTAVRFVEALPRTPSGKVMKRGLRELLVDANAPSGRTS